MDQILTVLLSTSMFVGGLIGFVLDNTLPGMSVSIECVSTRPRMSAVSFVVLFYETCSGNVIHLANERFL